ncbi:hypothetical protein [Paenibacillus sp. FSL R10-2748]|uniref:hypothetical protein n=1 Tax=Paenibacillus sp. FSL R10-2748 TaxID=2954658 RepID=UPI0030FACC57
MAKGKGRGSSKSPEVKVEKIPDGLEGTGEIQKRTYEPNPKHDPQSGWGSPNPIPDAETGQKLLDAAYSSSKNKQLYNIYEGSLLNLNQMVKWVGIHMRLRTLLGKYLPMY